ncbi:MAG: hypothetical protein EXQ57_03115 [Bryobacterales bacterium]|nr:hypothetical protein [Bryobacterales bacterium]
MLAVFFYVRLWRRSGVMTDIEFSGIRYSGKPAAFLRGFRALYFGLPINCIVLGWVNLAMVKILVLVLNTDKFTAIVVVLFTIGITSWIFTLAGLWGVLVTDVVQFFIKMTMVIVLAVCAVQAVGGMDAMMTKLAAIDIARGVTPGGKNSMLAFVPDLDSPYATRPWLWILTALASVILYPGLAAPETGYIKVMIDHMQPSLRGLMLAGFAAAYMSTIATQLNWGASYLLNDFYRRFLKPNETGQHYVLMSQAATVVITLISAGVTFYMDSIAGAWKLLIVTGAGTGGVLLLLRWYWWRVNASSFVVSVALQAI